MGHTKLGLEAQNIFINKWKIVILTTPVLYSAPMCFKNIIPKMLFHGSMIILTKYTWKCDSAVYFVNKINFPWKKYTIEICFDCVFFETPSYTMETYFRCINMIPLKGYFQNNSLNAYGDLSSKFEGENRNSLQVILCCFIKAVLMLW